MRFGAIGEESWLQALPLSVLVPWPWLFRSGDAGVGIGVGVDPRFRWDFPSDTCAQGLRVERFPPGLAVSNSLRGRRPRDGDPSRSGGHIVDTLDGRVFSGRRAVQDFRGRDASSPWSGMVTRERGRHPSLGHADMGGVAGVGPLGDRHVRCDRHDLQRHLAHHGRVECPQPFVVGSSKTPDGSAEREF